MTTTTLTFSGSADPHWLDHPQTADEEVLQGGPGTTGPDGPDPKGIVRAATSLVDSGGAVLVVEWVDAADDAYTEFLVSAAQVAGLTPGPANLGPDTTCSLYDVRAPSDPNDRTTGVPCILHRRH